MESFERTRTVIKRFAVSYINLYVTKPNLDNTPMSIQKKRYKNYIILENGAVIQKHSFKFWKTLELEKDNYNPNYILNLQSKPIVLVTQKSETFHFLRKYKK